RIRADDEGGAAAIAVAPALDLEVAAGEEVARRRERHGQLRRAPFRELGARLEGEQAAEGGLGGVCPAERGVGLGHGAVDLDELLARALAGLLRLLVEGERGLVVQPGHRGAGALDQGGGVAVGAGGAGGGGEGGGEDQGAGGERRGGRHVHASHSSMAKRRVTVLPAWTLMERRRWVPSWVTTRIE